MAKDSSEKRLERINEIKNSHGWDIPCKSLLCDEWLEVNNHLFVRVYGHIIQSSRIIRYKRLADSSQLAQDYDGQVYHLEYTPPEVKLELKEILDNLRGDNFILEEISAEERSPPPPSFLKKHFPWFCRSK